MSPIAAWRTRSHTVANETAWDEGDDEAQLIVSASEHSLSDSLHQRDDDDKDDDDKDDDNDDDDEASVAPLFEPVLDADPCAKVDADAEEEEVDVDAATMPHVHARMHAASTVGTCA